jgi:hypothetical protein
MPVEQVDIRAEVRARMLEKANAELPAELRKLTPAECRAKLREMGGVARLIPMREPGQDDEEAIESNVNREISEAR